MKELYNYLKKRLKVKKLVKNNILIKFKNVIIRLVKFQIKMIKL